LGSARTANGVVPIAYGRLKTIRLGHHPRPSGLCINQWR
jgi:hypothetical protein